jgi:predicted ATPase with chaperone activity
MTTILDPTIAPPIFAPDEPDAPPMPATLADTGLSAGFVADLLLKTLYVRGVLLGQDLAEAVRLPLALVDEQLHLLQQRQAVVVRGTSGHGRGAYLFDLAPAGRDRAQEALEASQYVGPAPVPLAQYRARLEAHSIRDVHVTRASIADGFRDVVLEDALLEALGPAINSAKSLFLYGESGNGKTLIADTIAGLLGGSMYVPHAVLVDGQILLVYDPVYHRPADEPVAASGNGGVSMWRDFTAEHDRRFVRVRRPVVVAGGELELDDLDLRYDAHTKLYQAPFQVKANGGVLIIDDFGRQRVPARDLLNRWIVPLEKRVDFLTLHTGSKFPIPFDCLLIFATNLDPKSLVDEAFLRRIHYKIHISDPTRAQYEEIFERCCAARGLEYTAAGVDFVYRDYYGTRGIAPRACHPRDLVDHLCDVARYLEVEARLTPELLERACASYFLDTVSRPQA